MDKRKKMMVTGSIVSIVLVVIEMLICYFNNYLPPLLLMGVLGFLQGILINRIVVKLYGGYE